MASTKLGRPEKKLTDEDFEKIDNMIRLGLTQEDILSIFNLSVKTLNKEIKNKTGMTFKEYRRKPFSAMKMSVRKKLYDKAVKGEDTIALIFLSKATGTMEERDVQMIKIQKEKLKELKKMNKEKLKDNSNVADKLDDLFSTINNAVIKGDGADEKEK